MSLRYELLSKSVKLVSLRRLFRCLWPTPTSLSPSWTSSCAIRYWWRRYRSYKPIEPFFHCFQDKLVDFLTKFHTDRSEDDQFNDEKAYLIKQIKELKALEQQGRASPTKAWSSKFFVSTTILKKEAIIFLDAATIIRFISSASSIFFQCTL